MKFYKVHIWKLLLIILYLFQIISCSRWLNSDKAISKENISKTTKVYKSVDPFEFALWNIKNNTDLFQKYLPESMEIIIESDLKNMKEALVIGEATIDGKEFKVTYDLEKTVLIDNSYKIPFLLENRTDDISITDELIWYPTENNAGLLLSFDDNTFDPWLQYFEIFDKYNVKVTFFVHGSHASAKLVNFCNKALSRGHDIGFHTIHHYNLNKVSHATFMKETIEGAESFNKAGIPLSSFAYPYGRSLPWMKEILSVVFPIRRGFERDMYFYNLQTIGNGYIISKSIDNITYKTNEEFEKGISLLLLIAKFTDNIFLPLTTHTISDTVSWGISASRLEFLINKTNELKLKFYTYREIKDIFYKS